jgi:hypothetical protein
VEQQSNLNQKLIGNSIFRHLHVTGIILNKVLISFEKHIEIDKMRLFFKDPCK